MLNENPNKKGTLGEVAVCKEFLKLGYEVFSEVGSHSKVDLIILDENYKTYKIQIKAVTSTKNVIEIYSIKNCLNPKYNSGYDVRQIDIFAICIIDKDLVFYVTSKELLRNGKSTKFRFSACKNGQLKNVRFINDYLDFKKALRDYTPRAQTLKKTGDEIVQTTTLLS